MIWLLLALSTLHAQELSFSKALNIMIDQNVNVRVQQTKLSASESQLNAARGTFTPQLYLQAQQKNEDSNSTAPPGVYAAARVYSANASWNIFRSGADTAGLRAAIVNRGYQTSLLEDSYLQAEDKSARALLDLIMKKQIVEAYRRSETSTKHFLEIAQARFKRSLLSREETDKVALDAANAEARRADGEQQYIDATFAVEALLGHSQVNTEWPWLPHLSEDKVKNLLNEEKPQSCARESSRLPRGPRVYGERRLPRTQALSPYASLCRFDLFGRRNPIARPEVLKLVDTRDFDDSYLERPQRLFELSHPG